MARGGRGAPAHTRSVARGGRTASESCSRAKAEQGGRRSWGRRRTEAVPGAPSGRDGLTGEAEALERSPRPRRGWSCRDDQRGSPASSSSRTAARGLPGRATASYSLVGCVGTTKKYTSVMIRVCHSRSRFLSCMYIHDDFMTESR